MNEAEVEKAGFAGRIAAYFINSRLTLLIVVFSMLLGLMAISMLPREEEPQIKVPMIDVMVSMPGATPAEVEQQITIPMEKLLYELPGVEYIYSTSMAGHGLLVVRFYVGEDAETAIVRLNQKLATNFDRIPHGVSTPLVKPLAAPRSSLSETHSPRAALAEYSVAGASSGLARTPTQAASAEK